MIKTIDLTFFRKHESTSIDFSAGLNVIRGPNEGGKTTLIEGVLYALYGSKALRNSLADTVTWGHKEAELKVRAVVAVGGVEYTFTRSKAGAECNFTLDGKPRRVTGQSEVTAFASDLLGADAKTASMLMLASQSGLRGALDDGPAAVSSLMGKLADFDLIDQILESATAKLLLGSEVPITAKLTEAENDLFHAKGSLPDPQLIIDLKAAIAVEDGHIAAAEKHSVEVIEPAMLAADEALEAGKQANERRRQAIEAYNGCKDRLANEQERLQAALADAGKRPDAARITQLRDDIASASLNQERVDAYAAFQALPAYPAAFWDTDKASFDAEVAAVTAKRDDIRLKLREIAGELTALKRRLITSGKCPTCGASALTDEHVAQHNAEVMKGVTALENYAAGLQPIVQGHEDDLAALMAVDADAKRRSIAVHRIGNHVDLDHGVYPPRVSWKGDVPQARPVGVYRNELQGLETAAQAAERAQGRVTAHQAAIVELEVAVQAAATTMEPLTEVAIEPLEAIYEAAYLAYRDAGASLKAMQDNRAEQQRLLHEAVRGAETAAMQIQAAEARVAECKADLVKLAFNNGLVKKLKTLKPMITDHLWGTVLAAVSNFFSTLRGDQSVVTKDAAGFRVNGQNIESLSGSTLDVLALAIRVALSKTFVPHASFMVLDEPAHGCDGTRTANVLGFLSGIGFTQTILASHDELSEAVADNVIALGA